MTTLYLTTEEQAVFASLSDALREGWTVEVESLPIEDSAAKRAIRFQLLRVRDARLLQLRDSIANAKDIDAVVTLIRDQNLKDIHEEDLQQIFFALGPVVVTKLIQSMLSEVQTDTDIEGITALTVIRHSLLSARVPNTAL